MKNIQINLLLISLIFVINQVSARPNINGTQTYIGSDGQSYTIKITTFSDSGRGCHVVYPGGAKDFNYAQVGQSVSGYGRRALIFDENDNFVAQGDYNANPISNVYYTDSGKILMYDQSNNLSGAYNDLFSYLAKSVMGSKLKNLNLVDEDGNYYEKDSHGNITSVYYKTGEKEEGKYAYSYDAGGNIITIYENGKQTYSRKIYTIEEATKAVANNKSKNTFSIKYR